MRDGLSATGEADERAKNGNGKKASAPVPAHYLDARDVEPTPAAFRQALERAGAFGEEAEEADRSVLMIDTFEALQSLERWFREEFFPSLPQATVVVVAGRTPPPTTWRAEAGLRALMRVAPLRNLPPEENRRYLAGRGAPEAEREAVATSPAVTRWRSPSPPTASTKTPSRPLRRRLRPSW